jgi:hypothetical protein
MLDLPYQFQGVIEVGQNAVVLVLCSASLLTHPSFCWGHPVGCIIEYCNVCILLEFSSALISSDTS